MANDELFAYPVADVVKRESAFLRCHLCVEHYLQKHVAQLLAEHFGAFFVYCLHNLIRFFDEIFPDALVRLLSVPRTSARRAKQGNDLNKIRRSVFILKLKIAYRRNHRPFVIRNRRGECRKTSRFFRSRIRHAIATRDSAAKPRCCENLHARVILP